MSYLLKLKVSGPIMRVYSQHVICMKKGEPCITLSYIFKVLYHHLSEPSLVVLAPTSLL